MKNRRVEWFWGALGAASLAIGVWRALAPDRSHDLRLMYRWARLWLFDHTNLYRVHRLDVDYPPNAFVLLSPLAFIPDRTLALVWALAQIALAPLAAYLAVRLVRPGATWDEARLPVVLFLSWGAVRAGMWSGQISLALLVVALAGALVARRSPVAGGALAGVSLAKPHIAAPVLLWALVTARVAVWAGLALVLLASFLVFAQVAGESLAGVVASYVDVLRFLYGTEHFRTILVGDADVRELVRLVVPSFWGAEGVHLLVILVLVALAWPLVAERRETGPVARDAVAIATAGLLALLTFFNLRFNLVLALPAMVVLCFLVDAPETLARGRWVRRVFWVAQSALVLDIPWVSRVLLYGVSTGVGAALLAVLAHIDRLVVLALFGALLWHFRAAPRRG